MLIPQPHLQCRGLKLGRAIPQPALRALVACVGRTFYLNCKRVYYVSIKISDFACVNERTENLQHNYIVSGIYFCDNFQPHRTIFRLKYFKNIRSRAQKFPAWRDLSSNRREPGWFLSIMGFYILVREDWIFGIILFLLCFINRLLFWQISALDIQKPRQMENAVRDI